MKIKTAVVQVLLYIVSLFSAGTMNDPASAPFSVTFLNVGQGDSALVECGGHSLLIDGGDANASRIVYSVLQTNHVEYLDYILATHTDADHVRGLFGAFNAAEVGMVYCNTEESDDADFAELKAYAEKFGNSIVRLQAGNTFSLGDAEVQVLAPICLGDKENDNSVVVRIVYGNTAFLFMADAEEEEEYAILDSGAELKCSVIKIGHHGSRNSTTTKLLQASSPDYAIISVGKDNGYKHPSAETLNRLKDCGVQVFRTDLQGQIICKSDGETVSVTPEKQTAEDVFSSPTASAESPALEDIQRYVLNTSSRKFHYENCDSVKEMKEKNKQVFKGTREEIIGMGYKPCGVCQP